MIRAHLFGGRNLFGLILFSLVSLGAAGPDPIIGPQIRIDVNGGRAAANETTASSIDPLGLEIVAAWNDWRRSTSQEIINMGVAVSSDRGVTWTDFLVRPPAANQSNVEGDPMSAYDHRTGTLWVGAISFASNGGVFVARKRPGQNAFDPSVMARRTGGADKCWMAAGRAHNDPNQTVVYIAYNEGLLKSTDLGQTWTGPVSLGSGIGFLPRVGPNGELYIAYWDFGNGVMLKRSLDGGATFTTHRIATRMDVWGTQDGSRFPGTFRVPSLNYIAVDPNNGTLYCIYFDTTDIRSNGRNVDLYFTKSTDRGNSWTTPRVINRDNDPPGDQFFPWLEVDKNGRIHLLFMDSRNVVQNDNVVHGMFDNYYAYSDDGGATWKEFRLTPRSYDSDNDGLNRSNQFLGDYLGLAIGGNRTYPVYLSTQNGDPDIYTHIIINRAPGDVNGDGCVNDQDLQAVLVKFGQNCSGCIEDLNGDGVVNDADLAQVLENFGRGC